MILFLLVGLVSSLAVTDQAASGPGQAEPPSQSKIDALVRGDLEDTPADSDSALIKLNAPPHWVKFQPPNGWPELAGWAVCYKINAKSVAGGYTGYRKYVYVISDDKIIYHHPEAPAYPDFDAAVFGATCPG